MKAIAAVVLARRGDLVLALTRGRIDGRFGRLGALTDLHLPGGKVEPEDGGDLRRTGARETFEETGLRIESSSLRHLVDYVTTNGHHISAFECEAPTHAPEAFGLVDGHAVGWVPPAAIVAPWCAFATEGAAVLRAAGILAPRARCPDCGQAFSEEIGGLRLPTPRWS